MNFKQALAQYVLGHLYHRDLPQMALQALEEGYDSPALAILAWLDGKESTFVIEQYFNKALAELGLSLASREQALLMESVYVARQVVAGEVEFSAGIARIDNLLFHYHYRWKKARHISLSTYEKELVIEHHIEALIKIYSLYRSFPASDILASQADSVLDESSSEKELIQMQEALKQQLALWLTSVACAEN